MQFPRIHHRAKGSEVRADIGDLSKPENQEKLARARNIIDDRSTLRSRSVSATLVFMGFLVGVQGAIVVSGITSDTPFVREAIPWTIVAMLVLFVGMLPTPRNIVPKYRNAEALEALGMDECDAYIEAANRSSAQRSQLWRLRTAMAVSLVFTAYTLYKLFVGLA